jgi:hypothetical protein
MTFDEAVVAYFHLYQEELFAIGLVSLIGSSVFCTLNVFTFKSFVRAIEHHYTRQTLDSYVREFLAGNAHGAQTIRLLLSLVGALLGIFVSFLGLYLTAFFWDDREGFISCLTFLVFSVVWFFSSLFFVIVHCLNYWYYLEKLKDAQSYGKVEEFFARIIKESHGL